MREEHGLLVTDDKELFVTHYGTDIYLERLGLGVHCSNADIVHALELQYYHLRSRSSKTHAFCCSLCASADVFLFLPTGS